MQNDLYLGSYIPELLSENTFTNNPQFVALIEAYLNYLEEQKAGETLQKNQSSYFINSITEQRDIDLILDTFITNLEYELGPSIPAQNIGDKRVYLKKLKELYLSRGTQESIDTFFRIFFDSVVEVQYTKENVLIPSSGTPISTVSSNVNTTQLGLFGNSFATIPSILHDHLDLSRQSDFQITFEELDSEEYFIADVGQTDFTIETTDVFDVTGVFVNDGATEEFVEKTLNTDYTVSGQTISFASAPPEDSIVLIQFKNYGFISVDGEPNKRITLRRGSIYTFYYDTNVHTIAFKDLNGNTVSMINETINTTGPYYYYNFEVPETAPDLIKYYCVNHDAEESGKIDILYPDKLLIPQVQEPRGSNLTYDTRRVTVYDNGVLIPEWTFNFNDYDGPNFLVLKLDRPLSSLNESLLQTVINDSDDYLNWGTEYSAFDVIYNTINVGEDTIIKIGDQTLAKNEDYYIDYVIASSPKEEIDNYSVLTRSIFYDGSSDTLDFFIDVPFHIRDFNLFGIIKVNGIEVDHVSAFNAPDPDTDSYFYNDSLFVSPTKIFFNLQIAYIDPSSLLDDDDEIIIEIEYYTATAEKIYFNPFSDKINEILNIDNYNDNPGFDFRVFKLNKIITQHENYKGFSSESTIVLQDSYRYQLFSYIIKTGVDPQLWSNSFNRLINPAGFIFFTEVLIIIYLIEGEIPFKLIPDLQPGIQKSGDLTLQIINPEVGILPQNIDVSFADSDYGKFISVGGLPASIPQINSFGASEFLELLKFEYSNPIYTFGNYSIQDAINNSIEINIASEITIS